MAIGWMSLYLILTLPGLLLAGESEKVYENGNIMGVQNGPSNPTQFTLAESLLLTKIIDYHYFNGGVLPGTIALEHEDGTLYGPWVTYGTQGQGGVPNAYWNAEPNVTIKPGTYTVIDSDPGTWSHNSGSNFAGFTEVHGIRQVTPAGVPALGGPNIVNGWTDRGFDYRLVVNHADSFTVEGLPEGLLFVPQTGMISGTLAASGNWQATVKATLDGQVHDLPLVLVFRTRVDSETREVFYNGNISWVQSGPSNPTRFTLETPIQLTRIMNYHYFNGGVLPGTIGLEHEDGTTYGPWATYGTEGQGGVNNASWNAEPMIVLKPGTYTVTDSHPATWSHNAGSNYAGFTWIFGYGVAEPEEISVSDHQAFSLWTQAQGLAGDDADPAMDLDHDNLPNWAEFARGTDPTKPGQGLLCAPISGTAAAAGISFTQRSGGQGQAGFDYRINGVSIVVEAKDKLAGEWKRVNPSSFGLQTQVIPQGDGTEKVNLSWPLGTPISTRFLRVRMDNGL